MSCDTGTTRNPIKYGLHDMRNRINRFILASGKYGNCFRSGKRKRKNISVDSIITHQRSNSTTLFSLNPPGQWMINSLPLTDCL